MHPKKITALEAELTWSNSISATSLLFDSLYFDGYAGIKKIRHTFLEQSPLMAQWKSHNKDLFSIGETGFGAGLNFLITAKAWLEYCDTQKNKKILHFVSVEKFPLSKEDLKRILSLVPELFELGQELLDVYPPPISGIHKLYLAKKRIVLTLMYGDGYDMLSSIKNSDHPFFERQNNPVFDTWFLDGFSPTKNKHMWSIELLKVIADLSRLGTTIIASTSEEIIRQRLEKVGFSIGITPKLNCINNTLVGVFKSPTLLHVSKESWVPSRFHSPHKAPWYLTPEAKKPKTAIVIGGGIAGCSTARSLAERGISVILIERHEKIGQEASGNPQGILYPKLSSSISQISRFGVTALLAASRYYNNLLDSDVSHYLGDRCGVLILPKSTHDKKNFKKIASLFPSSFVQLLKDRVLDRQAGLPLVNRLGLFFPKLGWICPPKACESLIKHRLITVHKAEVKDINLRSEPEEDCQSWNALDHENRVIASAPVMIIACAFNSSKFNQTAHLPINKVRGQTTMTPPTTRSSSLKTILCGKGYMLPVLDGTHTLGATYNLNENETDTRIEDHKANINQLEMIDPALVQNFEEIDVTTLNGRASFRCTTPDFLPIAGPAPRLNDYVINYKLMREAGRAHIPIPGSCWEGLYLNIGHGSRGLSYAPICADLVASQICGEVPPLELDLRQAIHPGRFIIRDIKKGKL